MNNMVLQLIRLYSNNRIIGKFVMVNRTVSASVHGTIMNAFKGTVNLKRLFLDSNWDLILNVTAGLITCMLLS
jgi:hypothetical protein